MNIHGIQKTTLQDFPGKVACIVFLAGCNFRCVYCHNTAAFNAEAKVSEAEFFSFLEERKGKLQGVVVSGGEPTIQKELPEFLAAIKQMGFLAKLDTNGSNPEMLRELLDKKLLDYIAMDVKAPRATFAEITKAASEWENVQKSIAIVQSSGIASEFRTTCHPLLSRSDLVSCAQSAAGADRYFLQQFHESGSNPKTQLKNYSLRELEEVGRGFKEWFGEVGIR